MKEKSIMGMMNKYKRDMRPIMVGKGKMKGYRAKEEDLFDDD